MNITVTGPTIIVWIAIAWWFVALPIGVFIGYWIATSDHGKEPGT